MISDKILNKIEFELKGKPSGFQLIGKGFNYDVYKFCIENNYYVLRLQKRATYDFSPIEFKLLKHLNGAFSPKLLIYDSGELAGFPFMVQCFIDGNQIDELNVNLVGILKKTIETIHEKTKQVPRYLNIKDYYYEIYKEKFGDLFNSELIPEIPVKSKVIKLADILHLKLDNLSQQEPQFECLIHGDLNPTNLLWKNDEVYLIDWELSRYSIPAIEYGAMIYCHARNEKLFAETLNLFDNNDIDMILTAFYLRLLDSLCWRIKYIQQNSLIKDIYDQQMIYLYMDLDKIHYPSI